MSSLSSLAATIHVAIGGAFGAALRYQAGRIMTSHMGAQTVATFPFPTLAVNTLGSLLIGLLAGWLARQGAGTDSSSDQLRLLLGVGLLGGFTTFSAFSLEMVMMIERGQFLFAALYGILSVSLGITGFMVGIGIMRILS